MLRMDGGARAASGLFYQYLFTIEAFLICIADDWPSGAEVVIEDSGDANAEDPDVVDFAIRHPDRGVVAVHQVKSTTAPASNTMSAAKALRILIRLVGSIDCPEYVVTTNERPGREINELNNILLAARDTEHFADDEFVSQLGVLVAASTTASADLAALARDPAAVARLRRGHVQATGETAQTIRRRIRQRVRDWRSEHGLALGEKAALLIEKSTLAEVFERAAGIETVMPTNEGSPARSVSLAAFTALLATSPHVLAEAVGAYETAIGLHHVPSGDGIVREAQLTAIRMRFDNVRSRRSRRCALLGRSGLGKTRLAAMYAHTESDTYDRVCWIDAESDAAVLASVVAQRRTLGLHDLEPQLAPEDVAEQFRASIAAFPGRWLIVFDNAHHPDDIAGWLPHVGRVNVLITSNNSVAWTAYRPVDVPPMPNDESVALLSSRLDMNVADSPAVTRALNTVAQRFEGWPLVIQIVAAHFGSLSVLMEGVDQYLMKIDAYVLNDETLDHDGYPRTVQAAIGMCLDRMKAKAIRSRDGADADAYNMLGVGSVLASRSIPATLLFTAAVVTETELRESGYRMLVPDESMFPAVDRAIRRIRSESLIERADSEENSDPDIASELRSRVEINEIVQRIVRTYFDIGVMINRAALHLGSWLDYYLITHRYAEAVTLQPHSLAVLAHAGEWAGRNKQAIRYAATLAGNQANLLDIQGRSTEAARWLNFEMNLLLAQPNREYRLIAKTSAQLIQTLRLLDRAQQEILPHATTAIEALEQAAANDDRDWDAELVRHGLQAWVDTSLNKSHVTFQNIEPLRDLQRRVRALSTEFPADARALSIDTNSEINTLVAERQDERALEVIDTTLADLDRRDHLQRINLSTYRVEVLAHLHRTVDLTAQLDSLDTDLIAHPQIRAGIASSLLNACFALCTPLVDDGVDSTLHEQLDRILRLAADLLVSQYDRWCHALFSAYYASTQNSAVSVRSILTIATTLRPTNTPDTVTSTSELDHLQSWLSYWLECADCGRPVRWFDAAFSHIQYSSLDADSTPGPWLGVQVPGRWSTILSTASYHAYWLDDPSATALTADLRTIDTGDPVARIRIPQSAALLQITPMPITGLILTSDSHPHSQSHAYLQPFAP
ncbi:NB-ARC domain-containing protein [Nocardia arthritidis]|uniref:Uncharacterized protein n=1 Tax=Nocardia arthritidis TaxID=228602 RepID=A0A6G9Y994_9NOCA|nr:NB-ARC domain-containing protein [Nocardia arthritidis]QIS09792.1 hypothetical protein F5544_09460 [Nocardia arthritidis]